MLKRDLGPVGIMGFARYSLNNGVDPVEFVAAAREWQLSFLKKQPGIAMHCLLGNLRGEFADAILATDQASFIEMSQSHSSHPSSAPLMEMLDSGSIRLAMNTLLGGTKSVPSGFSCIEFGTFQPKVGALFSENDMMAASSKIEQEYLPRFKEAKAHFMGKIDDKTYSEIAFVETSGAAREICNGYVSDPNCLPLLEQFEPTSVDLDFWHVLA